MRLGGPHGRSGRVRKIYLHRDSIPGTVHPVAGRYPGLPIVYSNGGSLPQDDYLMDKVQNTVELAYNVTKGTEYFVSL